MENWIKFIKGRDIELDQNTIREIEQTAQIHKTGMNLAFFIWLKNRVGLALSKIKDQQVEWHDLLSWLEIEPRPDIDWYVFEFEEWDDWQVFKTLQSEVESKLDSEDLVLFKTLSQLIINKYL